ncbi:imidazole glycerol phosphate synthase subunit HisH [Shewanella schlegeliana]|uniref:Imidazole glycerol phosphate synthase subunit HisH n=1 Tax=Shewanella schlegeliana TaxID=190308 RepID=A0ABS1STQ4_9GAMM|nr:imidazole glycerol phosphate synthase subunit HisH [Shewanella schlegeliana]MBL4911924.1 imidazole glycerol phosphate synthase subunit HisH [Shewanella schlegeliana]MCL1110123.1 imidazole glycerol phosphate synthase subunit HisH [Shewanella schlegeliana]GIU26855.1 imidazole glycerol phosphate synthase subunit HisH [Shewanella schlegeliana]
MSQQDKTALSENSALGNENEIVGNTVIIDTGCANLSSVRYAFERLMSDLDRERLFVTDDIEMIKAAERVVLPGVGTAAAAMTSLQVKGLDKLIPTLTQPLLGVCLGMQMLTRVSKERGNQSDDCPCLNIIPVDIDLLDTQGLPLPHMGWNQIKPNTHPIFDGIEAGSYVYFVHSYRAPISDDSIATAQHGETFSAAIAKDNFIGLQFHPEKSAKVGARMLQNFLMMDRTTFKKTNSKLANSQQEAQL